MFFRAYNSENKKIFGSRLWKISIVLLVILPTLINTVAVIVASVAKGDIASTIEQTLAVNNINNSIGWLATQTLSSFIIIMLIGSAIGQDYQQRTIQTPLMSGIGRTTLFLAKVTNLVQALLLLYLIPWVVNGLFLVIYAAINGTLNAPNWVELLRPFGLNLYATIPYFGLAVFLAFATRSAIATIGLTFGYTFVIEPALIGVSFANETAASVLEFLPISLGLALEIGSGMIENFSPALAIFLLGAYWIGLMLLGLLLFKRQDLSG